MKPRTVKEPSRCVTHTKQVHPLEQPCVVQDTQELNNPQSECTKKKDPSECISALKLHRL